MAAVLLVAHSWLRWVALLLGALAVVRAVAGRTSGRPWSAADGAAGRWYTRALDVQALVGLLLYFGFSPYLTVAGQDLGRAMATPAIRFWLVEHLTVMLVALALAHVGAVRIRTAATDAARFGRAALFFGLSLAAVVLASPWPGLAYARPLFRF
jgi:hypothetical protein